MDKKASSEMWWIIIGAVIALVVLIVLMVLFTSKTRTLETGLSSCESKGGICVSSDDVCPSRTLSSNIFDCGSEQNCCIGTPKSCEKDADCESQDCVDYNGRKYCR